MEIVSNYLTGGTDTLRGEKTDENVEKNRRKRIDKGKYNANLIVGARIIRE
jgi:hypothetical protein